MFVDLQELKYQQAQSPQGPNDKFVSMVSQFITVASFSFSEVEESLTEAKEVVSVSRITVLHIHVPFSAFKIF